MTASSPPPRATEAGTSRAEQRRLAAANLVISCYRLSRSLQLHGDTNQGVLQAVPPVVDAIHDYCALHGVEQARLLFSRDLVFVNRRIVRASKDQYALALQLGALLMHVGVNELGFQARTPAKVALQVMRALVDAQHDAKAAERLVDTTFEGATLRRAPDPEKDLANVTSESLLAHLVKTYASAILVLRGSFEDAQRGGVRRAHEVKRVAQKLVTLGDDQPELLVAMAAARFADPDVARRALSTAVVAVAMLRELTTDREALQLLAHAALTSDLGLLRLPLGADPARAAGSAMLAATLGGSLQPLAIRRTVLVHQSLTEVDGSDDRTVLASILSLVRRWNALRTPRQGAKGLGVGEAISTLEAEATTDKQGSLIRLLVAALGFYPLRTVVVLDTGEVAVVTGAPAMALDFARPPVQILTDAAQALRPKPLDIDLARPPRDEKQRSVVRALSLARGL